MAATNATVPVAVSNRRRRVRHKIQTPAYAIFKAKNQGTMLDLHEIVNISEDGMAIQCHKPLDSDAPLELCLDLAECPEQIYTSGQVIWSDDSGRVGFRFSELPATSLARLREWLFVNVMAGVANGDAEIAAFASSREAAPPRPNYTDTLAALNAVQRQVEALGADLKAALRLIVERAQALTHATGAAIALADEDPEFMICRASAGTDAPPPGARLQVGSGFSGECVKTATLLRCDDTEIDARVDRDSCRALGIRSILAAPVCATDESVGLLEVFSPQPKAFTDDHATVLRRLAESVLAAANRAALSQDLPPLSPAADPPFTPSGSVLFAAADTDEAKQAEVEKNSFGITLPRSHLIILYCAAAAIFLALGWGSAPWLQAEALPWIENKIHDREHTQLQTVLASSPKPERPASNVLIETSSLEQLRQMADRGNPDAQNALGLRYAMGEGVKLSETEAVRWFSKAAEQGNVLAQSKLGSIYFSGRGVPQDPGKAYFWMVIASSSGDDASKTLAPFVRDRLTRGQVTSIELEADRWLQVHRADPKPNAGQLRAKF